VTIKLIVLDLDGTILQEDMTISPRVRQTLSAAMAQGIRVTLASGRGYPSMRRWAHTLGIATPIICYQGAVITDVTTQQAIYERTFPVSLVPELRDFARQRDLSLTLYEDGCIYVENKRESDAFYDKWFGLPFRIVPDLATAVVRAPAKFLIIGQGPDLDALRPEVEHCFGTRMQIMRSYTYFLEGLPLGADKGTALAWLAERLGIRREETLALGDSGNDTAMVAWAGVGVAMGNATDEVKQVAQYVAPTIFEDGAAEAIERFCHLTPCAR
jgi:Cof subfamily protein (haloacid dehalogenase superfamily)